jgi:hypothetical protein
MLRCYKWAHSHFFDGEVLLDQIVSGQRRGWLVPLKALGRRQPRGSANGDGTSGQGLHGGVLFDEQYHAAMAMTRNLEHQTTNLGVRSSNLFGRAS